MSRIKNVLIVFVLVMAFGLLAGIASAQVVYDVVYARSHHNQPNTETVISVQNTSGIPANVWVEWINPFNVVIGVSGPIVIPPENTREFTTAFVAGAGIIEPYILDVPRVGGNDFEGGARVFSNTHHVRRLGVNATLVIDIDPNSRLGANYTSIRVIHPRGNRGD